MRHSDHPIILSLVSRRWHLTALSTPKLWSHVPFTGADVLNPFQLQRASLWLSCVKGAPVHLDLDVSNMHGYTLTRPNTVRQLYDAIAIIDEHLYHCEHLHIKLSEVLTLAEGHPRLTHSAPRLQKASVDASLWKPLDGVATLFGRVQPTNKYPLLINSNILTTLQIQCGSVCPRLLLDIFRLPLGLIHLTLNDFVISESETAEPDIGWVTNTSIEELHLCSAHIGDAVSLLGLLNLPKLHTLSIHARPVHLLAPPLAYVPAHYISNPFRSLHTLICDSCMLKYRDVGHLYPRMEILRTLDITHLEEGVSGVLQRSNPTYPGPGALLLFPLLEVVVIRSSGGMTPMGLCDMLRFVASERKRRQLSPLRRLSIPAFGWQDAALLLLLKEGWANLEIVFELVSQHITQGKNSHLQYFHWYSTLKSKKSLRDGWMTSTTATTAVTATSTTSVMTPAFLILIDTCHIVA